MYDTFIKEKSKTLVTVKTSKLLWWQDCWKSYGLKSTYYQTHLQNSHSVYKSKSHVTLSNLPKSQSRKKDWDLGL